MASVLAMLHIADKLAMQSSGEGGNGPRQAAGSLHHG